MSKIVLCADDSVTMQKVAEITFKGTEFTYVGARNADEALEKARGQKPALVLADAVMPGKSGYDLCQAIKADPKLAGVPVIVLCGNSAAYDAGRGAQVGADGTLSKPWDTQVMLEKVTEFLEKAATGGVAKPGAAGPVATPSPVAIPSAAPVSNPSALAAAAANAPKAQPPRSATIMGMPTIKLPANEKSGPVAAPVAAAPMAAAPMAAAKPAPAAAASVTAASASAPLSPQAFAGRSPMVRGVPSKRSALMEKALAKMSSRLAEQSGLEPGSPELTALLKLSTEIVERVVWEVVPELAEQIIRENLSQLTARRN